MFYLPYNLSEKCIKSNRSTPSTTPCCLKFMAQKEPHILWPLWFVRTNWSYQYYFALIFKFMSLFKCQLLFIFLTIYTKEVFKIRHIQNLFLQKFSLLQPLLLSLSLFRIHTNIFLLYFYFYLHLQIPYLHLLSYIHMPS